MLDNELPELECPEDFQQSTADNSNSSTAYYPTVNVTDNSGDSLNATCDIVSGSNLNIGNNTISCSATDNSDNNGTCSFVIYIIGKLPQTLQHVDITFQSEALHSLRLKALIPVSQSTSNIFMSFQ